MFDFGSTPAILIVFLTTVLFEAFPINASPSKQCLRCICEVSLFLSRTEESVTLLFKLPIILAIFVCLFLSPTGFFGLQVQHSLSQHRQRAILLRSLSNFLGLLGWCRQTRVQRILERLWKLLGGPKLCRSRGSWVHEQIWKCRLHRTKWHSGFWNILLRLRSNPQVELFECKCL